jgi:hypothetical protein
VKREPDVSVVLEESVTLDDPILDEDRLMLEETDTTGGPIFTVSEMARFFFARSSHWVRWLESCHFTTGEGKNKKECTIAPAAHSKALRKQHEKTWKFVLDGELLLAWRTDSNARKYDLALIEKIAHALASNGTITAHQLRHALLLVKIQSEMHEYL